jgi:N-methylhydantoinase B/oxoprolinase/acetone carboxylase alpha subunit
VASRGHHADIGGISMSPNATTIEQEGVYIDKFKLVDRGSKKGGHKGRPYATQNVGSA